MCEDCFHLACSSQFLVGEKRYKSSKEIKLPLPSIGDTGLADLTHDEIETGIGFHVLIINSFR